jgi:hypothetical protein
LASRGAAEVLTGFGDGNTGGSGEDQDMEEGGDLDLLATGHQRQVGQGVDSKIEDALTLEGLHTEAYTWGLQMKGGKGFLSLSEPLCFFEDLSVHMGNFNY